MQNLATKSLYRLVQLARTRRADSLAFFILAWGPAVLAQSTVPSLINYQGQLLNASGVAPANGSYVLEIRLFPTEIGGGAVWGPQVFDGQGSVGHSPKANVIQGQFNVVLGPKDAAGIDLASVIAGSSQLFLELKVAAGSPIAPRQQLLAAPYAFNSLNASNSTKLAGHDWRALFSNGLSGNPSNDTLAVHLPPSLVTPDAGGNAVALDAGARIRIRQGTDPYAAGIWFKQNNFPADRAFIGMQGPGGVPSDDAFGIWSIGYGWGLIMDIGSGQVTLPARATLQAGLRIPGASGTVHGLFAETQLQGNRLVIDAPNGARFTGGVCASAFVACSDRRVKKHIESIEHPLERVSRIRGVSFEFDSEALVARQSGFKFPDSSQAGVVAQEVQAVLPEAVSADTNGTLAVNYNALTGLLIEAVKAQQHQIEELRQEIGRLKAGRE